MLIPKFSLSSIDVRMSIFLYIIASLRVIISDLLINLSHDEDSLLNIPQTLGVSKKFDLFLDSHALFGEGLTLFAKSKSYSL